MLRRKRWEKERQKNMGTSKIRTDSAETFPHGNLVLLVCRGSVPASCCCDFGCVYPARTDDRVVGGMGVLAVILAGMGIRASVKGRREREKNYLTCKVGVVLNILILICLLMIICDGILGAHQKTGKTDRK